MFPFYGFSLVLLMTPERNSRSFSISIVSKSQGKAIKAENGNGINYLVWPIMETESKWWRPRLGTQPTSLRQLGQLQNTIIREKRADWKENLPDSPMELSLEDMFYFLSLLKVDCQSHSQRALSSAECVSIPMQTDAKTWNYCELICIKFKFLTRICISNNRNYIQRKTIPQCWKR